MRMERDQQTVDRCTATRIAMDSPVVPRLQWWACRNGMAIGVVFTLE